jgi:hypothetical protein
MNGVDARRSSALRVLKSGKSVIVYPGGSKEIFKTDGNSKKVVGGVVLIALTPRCPPSDCCSIDGPGSQLPPGLRAFGAGRGSSSCSDFCVRREVDVQVSTLIIIKFCVAVVVFVDLLF